MTFSLRLVVLLTFALLLSSLAMAAENDAVGSEQPTFFKDVLPILQENCQSCHRAAGENIGGMLAPMTLKTYDEVRPWAKSIARNVEARTMPPWFASEDTRGTFQHERRLSEADIATISGWAHGGAARGNPADAPPEKIFADESAQGWTNGLPDLVVSMPQPFWVADDVRDLNTSFSHVLTEKQLPEDAWISGVEFKVGGPHVHHMCASYKVAGEASSINDFTKNSLGCIALGAEPTLLPEGHAYFLPKGTSVQFSMHYHKEPGEGTGKWDQSLMGLIFAKEPVTHRVRYDALGNLGFEIPPGVDHWKVGASRVYHEDTTLLALWPHAHLRAVEARYEAFYPDGTQELLLWVPEYDQEWQTTYLYNEPKQIPAGTRIEATIWFNNSPDRAGERGFDSKRAIHFGGATTDEMMLGFLNFTHTEPVDFAAQPEKIETAGWNVE